MFNDKKTYKPEHAKISGFPEAINTRFPVSCIISDNIICYCLLLHLVCATVFYGIATVSTYAGNNEVFSSLLLCLYIPAYYTKLGKASVRKRKVYNGRGEKVRYAIVHTCLKRLLQKDGMYCLLQSMLFPLANLRELHHNRKVSFE